VFGGHLDDHPSEPCKSLLGELKIAHDKCLRAAINRSDAAIARMTKESTKTKATKERVAYEEKAAAICKDATAYIVEISADVTFPENDSLPSGSASSGEIKHDMLKRMLVCASQMGAQIALTQQPQQSLALENGGIGDQLKEIKTGLDGVVEDAARHIAEDTDHDQHEKALELAANRLIEDDYDDVMDEAVQTMLADEKDKVLDKAAENLKSEDEVEFVAKVVQNALADEDILERLATDEDLVKLGVP